MTIFSSSDGTIVRAADWFLVRDKLLGKRNGRDGFTLGEIRYGILDSQRICFTHEDEDRGIEDGNGRPDGRASIPCGRYRVTLPAHGRNILVNAVPGFSHVEIRAESGTMRNEGDITVGDVRALDGSGNSQPALWRLITELRRLTMQGVAVFFERRQGGMMCPKTEGATFRTGEETPIAPKDTRYGSVSGETTRQRVFRDIARILHVQFDSVPKIHLWI